MNNYDDLADRLAQSKMTEIDMLLTILEWLYSQPDFEYDSFYDRINQLNPRNAIYFDRLLSMRIL